MSTNKPMSQMTAAELQNRIAELEKQNAELVQKNTREIRMKVSGKTGAISFYGLTAQFPITLHYGQIVRLFEFLETPIPAKIAKFAEKHKNILSDKQDSEAVQASKLALRKASTDPDVSQEKPEKPAAK